MEDVIMEKPVDWDNLNVTKDLNNVKPTKSKNIYICSNEPKLNYTFTSKENADEDPSKLVITPREAFDYGVVIKKGEEETEDNVGTLDTTAPISYASIKEPSLGEEWYRKKFPNLPDEFYGVIARYTWGNPQTKKSIKNEKKKYEKKDKPKGKEPPQGLQVLKGKFVVDFS
tara:strand:+ start:2433 stop:2945 length:513 start_codon:yes stop_codon:yes gene_type:complete